MSNHYHFLVRIGTQPLSKLMAPVLGGFAGAYNRRYARTGYVFQNRFASILCDEENYLLELVRYIHLNPVRAGVVDNLDGLGDYPWTGHAGLLGRHPQDWQTVNEVLAHFGPSRRKAINRYKDFVQSGIESSEEPDFSGGGLIRSYNGWEDIARLRTEHRVRIGDERIVGNSAFVEEALEKDELAIESKSRLIRQGWNLDRLIDRVCELFEVSESALMKRSRTSSFSDAKAMICYWGTEMLGLTSREIAERLTISQPAVSKWIVKGRALAAAAYLELELDE